MHPRLVAAARALAPTPRRAVRIFVAANIGFLGVDIAIAHMANAFARPVEWAPVVFSAVATLLLLPGAFGSEHAYAILADRLVGLGAVLVGVFGMVLHLESRFFERQTLHQLVYSAPFVAPLAYVGVGLLGLLLHTRDAQGPRFGGWVLALALGGFVGNFGLSVLDHAQNGFFHASEWVPVAAAAYGAAFLAVAAWHAPAIPLALRRALVGVMVLEIVVGLAGAGLHVAADLHAPAVASLRDRVVYGAPPFAPLLFANLAVLSLLGVWGCREVDAAKGGRAVGGSFGLSRRRT